MRLSTLLAFVLLLSACGNSDTADSRAVSRAFLTELVVGGDFGRWSELCADDLEVNGSSFGRRVVEGTSRGLRHSFPDLTVTVARQVAEGDWVATRFVLEGTHAAAFDARPPTGARVEFAGHSLDRIVDGRVQESWLLLDLQALSRQIDAAARGRE
jgi:predicted ester cyclase